MMDNLQFTSFTRGYHSILLEEIALEGLDGITLEVLWIRLKNNPEWCLKPIDNNIQEFVWKKLQSLDDVRWYDIKQPRKTPPIFASFEDFYAALENDLIQSVTYSSKYYPHALIHDGDVVGSCPTYRERIDITDEINKLTLAETNERYSNQLVIVASQEVRNYFLLGGKTNPELEIPDISYCILERIGRSRHCGELSNGLQFLKNGANPTFYFWNRLKKTGLITTQFLNLSHKLSNTTLFYLPKFHKNFTSDITSSVYAAVTAIKSSPKKFVPLIDIKALFPPDKHKATKSDLFRRYIKIENAPFKECYPDSTESDHTKNGSIKVVRVAKLTNEDVDPEVILLPAETEDEADKQIGILKGSRLLNRPLIVQCYNSIHEKAVEGISMADLGAKLGLNKLITRLMLKSLKRIDLVSSISFDNGRQRYYRYYAKKYDDEVQEKLKEQLGKPFTLNKDISGNYEMENSASNADLTFKSKAEAEKSLTENADTKDSIENNTAAESGAVEIIENTLKRKTPDDAANPRSLKKLKTGSSAATQSGESSCEKSPAKTLIPANESVYFIRRTNIVLEYVYNHQVVIAANLLKVIRDEETKLGVSRGTPCPKSIKRIVNMLVQSKKLTEIKKVIVEEQLNKTKAVNFVCAPSVTEDHPIIQTTVANIKKNLSILFVKPSLGSSNKKVQEFRSKLSKQRRSKENDMKYGFAPKFARMRILHEFITYLVYHYKGDENLNQEESLKYIKNFCSDFDKNEEIPKVYFKEISSRMFVPPLMKYEEYGSGWTSLNDVIERMPLKMLFSLVRFSYYVPGIEAYLKHPVKQFYLMRHLPYDVQQIITADKKYISSINGDLKNLCLIGLAQFGPKVNIRGNTNLLYVNTKTELMDTRPCPPTFFQINPNLAYTKYYYDFVSNSSTENYWNDAFRFCVGTRLCRKQSATTICKRNRKLKPELLPYIEEHAVNDASKHDDGQVPGDGLGAAGYDSTLYSHFIKQWFLGNADNSAPVSVTTKTSSKQLRLKSSTQLKRMRLTLQKKRRRKRTSESYDKTDLEALQKMQTLRAQWSKTEDEILLYCYVASRYYIPPALSSYMPSAVFRKILHEKSEVSASKTSHSCSRRIKNILKNPLRRHCSNLLLKDVLHNDELRQKVQGTINEIDAYSDSKDTTQCVSLLDKLTEQVFNYLYGNSKLKINAAKGTIECKLPDTLEEFRNDFIYEYPVQDVRKISRLTLLCESDAIVILLTALIYSTLFSQVDKTKSINVNYLYQIFKNFDDEYLKLALTFVRANRLVSLNKYGDRLKSSLLPIGKGTYHFSITFHTILKTTYNVKLFSLVYEKCLEFLRKTDTQNFDIDVNDVGINLILIGYMIHDKIDFNIKVPENIMFFNPSPVAEVDPENTVRPMFKRIESHTQKTLSLIQDTFFKSEEQSKKDTLFLVQDTVFVSGTKNEKDNGNESNKKPIRTKDEDEKFSMLSDSDSDEELSLESEDKLEQNHGRRSKIAVFLTRSQFKQSYVRFSNAYDHFLINKFLVSFDLDHKKSCFDILADGANLEYCQKIEKNLTYKKIKYTSTELTEMIKKKLEDSQERDYALHVLEYLQSIGVAGASSQMLANEFRDLNLLKKVTDVLCQKKLVLRSGSQYTHYIHIDYAHRWLIPCWKNIDAFYDEKNPANDSALPTVTNRVINEKFELRNDKNQIWLAVRPWMQINGTINKPALESLLIRVLTHICKNPGISLERLQRKFEPALLPHWTRELLEILLELQVVQWNVSHVPKVSLLSKNTYTSVSDHVTGFEDETTIFIEPDVNCLTKLSLFIASTDYEDLMETKYVLGEE